MSENNHPNIDSALNELTLKVETNNTESTHIESDIEPSNEGSFYNLAPLIASYKKYYENKNDTNISLRKKYFACSFALIFILVIGLMGMTLTVCFFVKDNLAVIISLLGSIAGLVPSVLLLPRIIGEYIFPKNEYDAIKTAIEHAGTIHKKD